MSEIEDLKQYIKDFCPEVPLDILSDNKQVENDSEIDWESIFTTYVTSIKDLASKDIVEN